MIKRLRGVWARLRRPPVVLTKRGRRVVERSGASALPPEHVNCGCFVYAVEWCVVAWVDERTEEQGFSMKMSREAAGAMVSLAAQEYPHMSYLVMPVDECGAGLDSE